MRRKVHPQPDWWFLGGRMRVRVCGGSAQRTVSMPQIRARNAHAVLLYSEHSMQ
jgi:hypothetical protein